MRQRRRVLSLLFLAAALALAVLGQFYFFKRPEYLWDGLVFHGLAVVCFLLAWRFARRRASKASRTIRVGVWLRTHSMPVTLLMLGLVFSLVATLLARNRVWSEATGDAVGFWILGMISAAVAAFWLDWHPLSLRQELRGRLRGVGRSTWLEMATVAGLTLLALLLRVMQLGSVPFTLGGDEAWHGLLARQVLDGELRNPFVMGYMSMPTLFYWPLSWSLRLAGNNVLALRLPAALVGTATIPLLYFFVRRMWGRRVALLGAAFLATYDYHIHFSRLGANNVWDALFVLLTMWALDVGLTTTDEGRRSRSLILAGLTMGLSVYFYTGARLLPFMVVVYIGYFAAREFAQGLRCTSLANRAGGSDEQTRASRATLWYLVLMVLAFLVAAAPMLSFALAHADDWSARVNQVGIIQSGWLAREPALTGKSTMQILGEQFLRAAGAFHVYPDRTAWYDPDRPLLGFVSGVFALLGMAWAVAQLRERRYFLVLLWFWSVIIAGGMLTESPPSSQRLVIAIPAVALLVAISMEQVACLALRVLDVDRKWGDLALGLLVLTIAWSNINFYFVDYSRSRRYGSENGETATMIGHYLVEVGENDRVYLFGAPSIYWKFGTMSFMAPDLLGEDVIEPLDAPPDFVDKGRAALFIFLPEREDELTWVRQAFPDGRTQEVRDTGGRLRFTAYEVGP